MPRISRPMPAVTITVAPKALASWIAVVPMPLEPPWTSSVSPGCSAAALEDVGPDGEEGLGNAGRLDHREALRDRQGIRLVRRRSIRHSRRRDQRADPRRRLVKAGDARPGRHDLAGDLEARDVGRAGRRRIAALPLQHVGPVDAGRVDLDQDLAADLGAARCLSSITSASGPPGLGMATAVMMVGMPDMERPPARIPVVGPAIAPRRARDNAGPLGLGCGPRENRGRSEMFDDVRPPNSVGACDRNGPRHAVGRRAGRANRASAQGNRAYRSRTRREGIDARRSGKPVLT